MRKKLSMAFAGVLFMGAASIGEVRAFPCSLSAYDMQSLAHPICDSCTPLTKAGLAYLSPEEQASLCKARHFYAAFHEKLSRGLEPGRIADSLRIDDIHGLDLSRFWTINELKEWSDLVGKIPPQKWMPPEKW